ncbi:MAG: hypothetical protein HY556_08925 [Euryarchaeota archaeon]|nr:hypothetical protein [Euryarchaeota archaeon]
MRHGWKSVTALAVIVSMSGTGLAGVSGAVQKLSPEMPEGPIEVPELVVTMGTNCVLTECVTLSKSHWGSFWNSCPGYPQLGTCWSPINIAGYGFHKGAVAGMGEVRNGWGAVNTCTFTSVWGCNTMAKTTLPVVDAGVCWFVSGATYGLVIVAGTPVQDCS